MAPSNVASGGWGSREIFLRKFQLKA